MTVEEQRCRAMDGDGGDGHDGMGVACDKILQPPTYVGEQKQHSSPKNNNTYAMESINVCTM